ncbi:MAG: dicarboxylate/amino acid:cation symporter [Bacillota bacterium]
MKYIVLFVTLLVGATLYIMQQKKVNFGVIALAGMLFGTAIGVIFEETALVIEPIGKIFTSLIKMLVLPLVITAIITSVASLKNTKLLKSIGLKSIILLLFTTAIASVIGIAVAEVMNLGSGISYTIDASFKAREIPVFGKVLLDMLPANPIASMAEGKIIPVVIFSLFIAIAIVIEENRKPGAAKPVLDFFNSFARIIHRMTKLIIRLAPYGAYALMASIAAKNGLSSLIPLSKLIIAVYIACLLHIIFTYSSMLVLIAKVNPLKFFKNILPAQIVAFTTQSSYGTLPVTIKSLVNRTGISEKVASFVAPIGATVGMNACGGIYPAMIAIFTANIFNIELTISHYIMITMLTVIGSIGIAGVPGIATIATTLVLTGAGLPVESIAIVLGVDVVIDMIRTMTNVTGASVVSLLVAKSENEFDKSIFDCSYGEVELESA